MIDYSKFKRGPDFTGWMRAPQAEKFVAQLGEQQQIALAELFGACSVTTDPAVARKFTAFNTVANLTKFLVNSRKESSSEDE
jgi:hypothetical protein